MKKNIILTVALTAVMSQTAFAADAASSASATTETKTTTASKPATTSSKTTSTKTTSSKTTSTKTTTATKPAAVTAKEGDTTYVVKYGDTLNDIAAANGTTASALASYNKIANANRIYVGQTIVIPGKVTTVTTNTTDVVYTVVAGDTLDKIAKANGTTYQELAKVNNLSNPNKLSIGQKITIPGKGEVVTPVTPEKPVTPVTPVEPVTPVTPEKPVVDPQKPEVDPVPPTTPDVVTTASLVSSADELATSLSSAGTWITCPLNDVTVDGELNVDGTFYNKNDETKGEYRKLGLYTQDENKKVLEQFELNVEKMNVNSPNFKIQNGTVNGDIIVDANGFAPACTVNGNIVFCSTEQMSSADLSGLKLGEGFTVSVTEAADTVSSASITDNANDVVGSLSKTGNWITCTTADVTVPGTLTVEGTFYNKNNVASGAYRKLGLYTQDENKKVLDQFALTVDKMDVKSPNFKIQNGTVNGDIYVSAKGFTPACTVNGNIVFANREAMATANLSGLTLGEGYTVSVAEQAADAVTTPSITTDAKELATAVGTKGNWIACTEGDVTVNGDLNVVGNFYGKNDYTRGLDRKIALYTQDADKNVTGEFALNVANLNISSPNTRIVHGTVNGNVNVNATGFKPQCTINGNVVFTTQEAMDSADLSGATITGSVSVVNSTDSVATAKN